MARQKAASAGNLSADMSENLHQLRCLDAERDSGAGRRDLSWSRDCGDLFEVEYPGCSQGKGPYCCNPGALSVFALGSPRAMEFTLKLSF